MSIYTPTHEELIEMGFMPQRGHGDYSQLTDSEKAELIDLCLDTIWRKTDDLTYSLYIENIQSLLTKVE